MTESMADGRWSLADLNGVINYYIDHPSTANYSYSELLITIVGHPPSANGHRN